MQRLILTCALGTFLNVSAAPQETATAPPRPKTVKLYDRETAQHPATLFPPEDEPKTLNACKGKKEKGSVALSFIVDATGRARNISFTKFTNNSIDFLASQIIERDQFFPASLNGQFVATNAALKMDMEVCAEVEKQADGTPMQKLFLRAEPVQKMEKPSQWQDETVLVPIDGSSVPPLKVDSSLTAPTLLHDVQPEYSESARLAKIQGLCIFQLTVDKYGLPRNIKELKAIDPSLQENAYLAIWQYRFKPAMRDGLPVSVQVRIEVNFQLY